MGSLSAQTSGSYDYFNQWYQFNQNYIKILVNQDGFYRVSESDLVAAGVNTAGLDPANLQVIYRGQEVPIRTILNGSQLDFFEFYGAKNDGHLDSLIYREVIPPYGYDPEQQPTVHSSFFSDTSAYFVTWDAVGSQRYDVIPPTNYGAYNPEPWYRYRAFNEHVGKYFPGGGSNNNPYHVLNPDYVTGEGFIGFAFEFGGPPNSGLSIHNTPGFANSGTPSDVVCRAVHTTTSSEHVLAIQVDGTEHWRDTTSNINIGTRSFSTTQSLGASTTLRYVALGNGSRPDVGSPCWDYIEYDRDFDLQDSATTTVRQWTRTDTTYLRFTNASVTSQAWIYDPTLQQLIAGTVTGDTLHFLVPGHPGPRDLLVYTDNSVLSPAAISNQTSLANLSDVTNGAEFVIITHRKFANSANQYRNYRDTCTVNQLSAKVVYVDEIYDEFGYGSLTPWAIKNFCKYALDNWDTKPRFFLLWGKGRPAPKLDDTHNYVPTFGEPANDFEYVSNFDRNAPSVSPEAAMGRVSIYEDSEGLTYLNKINEY